MASAHGLAQPWSPPLFPTSSPLVVLPATSVLPPASDVLFAMRTTHHHYPRLSRYLSFYLALDLSTLFCLYIKSLIAHDDGWKSVFSSGQGLDINIAYFLLVPNTLLSCLSTPLLPSSEHTPRRAKSYPTCQSLRVALSRDLSCLSCTPLPRLNSLC